MSKKNDISNQIHKYLNGELDARAMHQLEREVLNDPFLAEALEGYEKAGTDQEQNLSDIHSRLQERITEKRRRIVLWRTISIAASVLIVLTIGGLWLRNEQPGIQSKRIANTSKTKPSAPVGNAQPANNIAQQGKKPVLPVKHKKSPVNNSYVAANNGVAQADASSSPPTVSEINTNKSLAAADIQKDSAHVNEVVVTGYGTQKRKDVTYSVATIQPPPVINKDSAVAMNRLTGKVAGIQVFTSGRKTITGTVVAKEDGLPIPGVTVKIKGTNIGTRTNSEGKFTLNAVPVNAILQFNFIGYTSEEIALNKKDMIAVAMTTSGNSLSEVVVTQPLDGNGEQEYQSARPVTGWSDYKKYLKNNATSPDSKTGIVKLSFIVNTDNSLNDFKIIKSVSAITDSAAVNLVRNGPGWLRNTDNKPHKVRLRIKFTGK